MSLRVRRSLEAEVDLDDIFFRIALDNPTAAQRVVERIEAAEERLGAFPLIGQARSDLAEGLRHWPIPPYIILYRVEAERLLIVRIVHGARDLGSLLER